MTRPVLVVDFGTSGTSAAVVAGRQVGLVKEPLTGALRWPSAPGPVGPGERQASAPDLLATGLPGIRAEAERLHGGLVERLALAVPASYRVADPRREMMISAATAAGFPDVELVSDSVAAVLDPRAEVALPDGSLVLVCDLGATWSASLLRVDGDRTTQLGQETSTGGRDIDTLLISNLRATLHNWIEPLLGADGDAGARAYHEAADFVRRLKHRLSDVESVTELLRPDAPPYRLNRTELGRFTEPALRWLVASCRAVLARTGVSLSDVVAVMLVGGAARLPSASATIQSGLGCPVLQAADPELAVIRGAARWAAGNGDRRLSADPPRWRAEPLSWRIPDGEARLVRWLVGEGQSYPAGALLAQVRTADDLVYDLTADREGVLLEHRVHAGAVVGSAAVTAMTRSALAVADDRPAKRLQLRGTGDWLLTPDRTHLVECAANGAWVKVRALPTGSVVGELHPPAPAEPYGGRVFVSPLGHLTLVSWDAAGEFFVFDIASGTPLATFRDAGRPAMVLVNEAYWRLVAETGRTVQVGRYRREVATMWDLDTGTVIQELGGDDLQHRHPGYAARSAADAFATEMGSPDGRLHAATTQNGGEATLELYDAHTGRELFRATEPTARWVRTAFSADGAYLLAHWRSDDTSWVDVWEV